MLVNISPGDESSSGTNGLTESRHRGRDRPTENGDAGCEEEGKGRGRGGGGTGIYACEPERPLYVVDVIIYDTYRSQLRVMALTLVFMAILFLVAFHGLVVGLAPSLSSLGCSWETSGPYAKQAVILV